MNDAQQFLNIVDPKEGQGSGTSAFRLGSIPSDFTNGWPIVLFEGETIASSRRYTYLSSYTPAPNDKVLLARVSNGWVILGKIM